MRDSTVGQLGSTLPQHQNVSHYIGPDLYSGATRFQANISFLRK